MNSAKSVNMILEVLEKKELDTNRCRNFEIIIPTTLKLITNTILVLRKGNLAVLKHISIQFSYHCSFQLLATLPHTCTSPTFKQHMDIPQCSSCGLVCDISYDHSIMVN